MSAVGRNDPCPCGSGRKFKKCCMEKMQVARPPFTREDRERVLARLTRFSARPEFEQDHMIAQIAFWGDGLQECSDEEARETLALPTAQAVYQTWFAFDVPIEDGRTLTDLFLERERARLSAAERAYLEQMRGSHMRLYEVMEVKPEEGFHLVDLWTNEGLWVRERLATRQVVRWDILAARVVSEAEGVQVFDGGLYLYPTEARDVILKDLRRAYRLFTRRSPGEDLRGFFKRTAVLFHRSWLDWVVFPPKPTLVTPDGDLLILARAIFDVLDREALVRVLASHPDLVEQDDDSYVWLEAAAQRSGAWTEAASMADTSPGDASHVRRGLGTFALKPHRVELEAMSRERAERGRRFLEELAGEAVRYRATRYEDVERALEKSRRSSEPMSKPEQSDVPPEIEAQIVGQLYEQHYGTWLDRPVPALGNRTPRQAARLKTVRPRLIALLKDFENHSERMRLEGRPAYEFGWMWQELGLERPRGKRAWRRVPVGWDDPAMPQCSTLVLRTCER